jgi:hypothetical protein
MSIDILVPGLEPTAPGPSDIRLATDPAFFSLLRNSYQILVGKPLVPGELGADEGARWLYEDAPFFVLVHNRAEDPRFVYANKTAQACFEYSWDEITRLPSRLSAEAPNRGERQQLLDAVSQAGFSTGYRGARIARSGRRFWIEDATVWQLVDHTGAVLGQAAKCLRWSDM